MKYGVILSLGALAVAVVAVAAMPVQDAKTKAGTPDQAAMVAAMKKAGTPGEQHREFAACVGTWQTRYTCWMDPSAPAQESTGTSTFETIMDGRFMVEHASGTMAFGPFEGMGILGYDNTTGEYEHVWLCNSGTSIMTAHGTQAADGTKTLNGEMVDPMTKSKVNCRMVCTQVGANEKRLEMYCNKSGKDEKMMEVVYTRGEVGMR